MSESETGFNAERSKKSELLNFDNLDERRLIELKRAIEVSKGRIIAFIHPYFPERESVWTDIGTANPEDLKKMRTFLEKLSALEHKNSPPVFVFEEQEKMQILIDKLSEGNSRNIYVVPTVPGDPTPVQGGWDLLNKKFSQLGVKETVIAGMNLIIYFPTDDYDPRPAGCVAEAAEEFAKKFKVSMSQFVYPNTRDDYYRFKK